MNTAPALLSTCQSLCRLQLTRTDRNKGYIVSVESWIYVSRLRRYLLHRFDDKKLNWLPALARRLPFRCCNIRFYRNLPRTRCSLSSCIWNSKDDSSISRLTPLFFFHVTRTHLSKQGFVIPFEFTELNKIVCECMDSGLTPPIFSQTGSEHVSRDPGTRRERIRD